MNTGFICSEAVWFRGAQAAGTVGGGTDAGGGGGVLEQGPPTPAEKRLIHGVNAIEHQRLPFDPVGATVIAECHLVCRSLRDANGGAIQPLQILHAAVAPDDKTLAVIEIDRPLPQAEGYAAQIGLRRIAIEHVDLA